MISDLLKDIRKDDVGEIVEKLIADMQTTHVKSEVSPKDQQPVKIIQDKSNVAPSNPVLKSTPKKTAIQEPAGPWSPEPVVAQEQESCSAHQYAHQFPSLGAKEADTSAMKEKRSGSDKTIAGGLTGTVVIARSRKISQKERRKLREKEVEKLQEVSCPSDRKPSAVPNAWGVPFR